MFIDSRLEFSHHQITTDINQVSTHIIDTQARAIGPGTPIYVMVAIEAPLPNHLAVTLQTSNNEAFNNWTTNVSVWTHKDTPPGAQLAFGIGHGNMRYLRLRYGVAGQYSAWLTSEPNAGWQSYPAVV